MSKEETTERKKKITLFKSFTVDGIKVEVFPDHYGSSSHYFDELRKDKDGYSSGGFEEPHTYLKWDRHEISHLPPIGPWDAYRSDHDWLEEAPTGTVLRAKAKEAAEELREAIERSRPENTYGISPEALAKGEPFNISYEKTATRYPKKNSEYAGWLDYDGLTECGSGVGGTFALLTVVDEDLKKKLREVAEGAKKIKAEKAARWEAGRPLRKAEEELREKEKEAEEIANRVGTRTEAIAKAEREFDEEVKKLDSAREEALEVKEKLEALKEDLEKVKGKETT